MWENEVLVDLTGDSDEEPSGRFISVKKEPVTTGVIDLTSSPEPDTISRASTKERMENKITNYFSPNKKVFAHLFNFVPISHTGLCSTSL
jgi:hypothetical protein